MYSKKAGKLKVPERMEKDVEELHKTLTEFAKSLPSTGEIVLFGGCIQLLDD